MLYFVAKHTKWLICGLLGSWIGLSFMGLQAQGYTFVLSPDWEQRSDASLQMKDELLLKQAASQIEARAQRISSGKVKVAIQDGQIHVNLASKIDPESIASALARKGHLQLLPTWGWQKGEQALQRLDTLYRLKQGLTDTLYWDAETDYSKMTEAEKDSILVEFRTLFPFIGHQLLIRSPHISTSNPIVGHIHQQDRPYFDSLLTQYASQLPPELALAWSQYPVLSVQGESVYELIALRQEGEDPTRAFPFAEHIHRVAARLNPNWQNWEIQLDMDPAGTKAWAALTAAHNGSHIAIVIDGRVYSYPKVQEAITVGKTVISGQFSETEARLLAAVLASEPLPAPMKIISLH